MNAKLLHLSVSQNQFPTLKGQENGSGLAFECRPRRGLLALSSISKSLDQLSTLSRGWVGREPKSYHRAPRLSRSPPGRSTRESSRLWAWRPSLASGDDAAQILEAGHVPRGRRQQDQWVGVVTQLVSLAVASSSMLTSRARCETPVETNLDLPPSLARQQKARGVRTGQGGVRVR